MACLYVYIGKYRRKAPEIILIFSIFSWNHKLWYCLVGTGMKLKANRKSNFSGRNWPHLKKLEFYPKGFM